MKTKYEITVGEVGDVQGHTVTRSYANDAAAIRAAKRRLKPYARDGWYIVRSCGETVQRGGRMTF